MSAQQDRSDSPDEAATAETAETETTQAPQDADEPSEIEALQAKVEENWDKYVRAAAELDNVRKRAARDVENAHRFALERFATDLLAVVDSLEMALSAGDDADVDTYREGSEATLKLLTTVLQRFGVDTVDPAGEPFDPNCHEAMTVQPSADAEPGSVLTVYQKGYSLNGRLLRPARVVVAAEPAESGEKG